MSITAGELVSGQKVISVDEATPISKVLTLMVQHDYSQLPVLNEQGKSVGLITGDSIARVIMRLGKVNPVDLVVRDAIRRQPSFPFDTELFELLKHLLSTPGVIINDASGVVCGVITFHDAIKYFQQQALDMLLIKDIETAHRQHIAIVLDSLETESISLRMSIDNLKTPATEAREKVKKIIDEFCEAHKLLAVTEEDKNTILDASFPIRKGARLDQLTLAESIQLAQKVWSKLNVYYKIDPDAWKAMMDRVREIRNALMHFRDDTTQEDREHLEFWADWFKNHRPEIKPKKVIPTSKPTENTEKAVNGSPISGYSSLAQLLAQEQSDVDSSVTLSFHNLEIVVAKSLPQAAREHIGWWSDEKSQVLEWLPNGWVVGPIDIEGGSVTFKPTIVPRIIDLQNRKSVTFWCDKFGCTEERLIAVVEEIGEFSDAVASYFQTNAQ
ncbi:CBS domain-containing protein [Hymenobacter sp. BT635]|uniref:CBS domain-containing protein n=1 Tax=Hymenobacter nitidus TaxID=2880929 RepID=A0ABS8AKQ4_9BACT|nr:CBS domain-containing protein [Hymenobacter nitidus]MCB2380451.1 CBS domain-containing protein [Hymenobacter nitidus]